MGFIKEFREFAVKGNVMDLAVGVIIGGAFNKIVTALVESVIMPIIAMFVGDTEQFSAWTIGGIKIGILIQAVLDFLIIAFILFLIVRFLNKIRNQPAAEPPAPTKTETLLEEIRDSLKK